MLFNHIIIWTSALTPDGGLINGVEALSQGKPLEGGNMSQGTLVGENPTPYGILALWAVNGLSIVYWECYETTHKTQGCHKVFKKLSQ